MPTPTTTPTPAAKKNTNIFGKLFSKRKEASPSLLPPGGAVDLSVAPPSKAAIGTVPSPIPEGLPPAPTSPGFAPRGHARNLSNTINNAFRRSPSPAKDVRPSTSTGASGGLTTPKRSAFSRSGGDKEEGNGYGDTLNPNPGTTSSRLSTSSRHSHHSAHESTNNGASSSQNPQQQLLLPATLGIQPTLSTPGGPLALSSLFFTSGAAPSFNSAGYPPPKHLGFGKGPALYVWVVRKWMKGGNGGLFGLSGGLREVLSGIGSAAEGEPRRSIGDAAPGQNGGVTGKLEVRVEWKRGKKPKAKKDKRKEKEGDSTTNSRNPSRSASRAPENTSRTSLGQTNGNGLSTEEADENGRRKSLNRLSALSGASVSASEDLHDGEVNTGSKRGKRARSRQSLRASLNSLGGGAGAGRDDDDGDESDPEDSETPWVCTLKVRRLGAAPPTPSASKIKGQKSGAQQGAGEDTSSGPLKIKVGTLSPTPHHPKVVAMLKVPWPLPDLEVERMQVRKRDVSNPTPGSAGPGSIQAATERLQGLSLTAEEIKDVICSTGMWVVVREGFGGVGRVSRKGDGWRIRA
ncbi:hypothetical protein VKT23_014292 [Stygiomarasmius scandens]|uniref:Uncharacterized protein n=1 Tax=Marasmiellus scandens TaxID=2682957 RepID=A0ABR1J4D1_9AGAR